MIALLLAVACGPKAPPALPLAAAPVDAVSVDEPAVAGVDSPLLRSLLSEHWQATMARYPQWAASLGERRYEHDLFDPSEEGRHAWVRRQQEWALRAGALPDPALSPRDRVTRDLLLEELRTALATRRCRFHQWSVSARDNALVRANGLAEDARLDTPDDAAALLDRYQRLPDVVAAESANLRAGLAGGRVGNRGSIALAVEMLAAELATPVEDSPLFAPATRAPAGWGGADAWREGLRAAIADGIRPALEDYQALIRDELMPVARTGADIGLHALPEGPACYEALIRENTTRALSADTLHETGLAELASVHAEIRELGSRVLGTDDLSEIFERLRTDPTLYFATSEEVAQTARDALERSRAAIPLWFGRLPAAPCVVEAVPDYVAPYTTIAYYQPARPDGSRPGIYYVNTTEPGTRPRYEAEVLAFHESIPGHHLQIVIGQDLGDLPAFRRHGGFTAFVEGWGLYTERLADEMGLYSGDLDRLGMLSFDSWRASRLVVDTGLHARGWTREQAEAFLLENTPLAQNNIVNEVDRYITTPGQALAYKVGQMELRTLRAESEAALGGAFDIREFHDVVLGGGSVTLPVLADTVHQWIERNTQFP